MKNVSGPEDSVFRKKGFLIAIYSCMGIFVLLAALVTVTTRRTNEILNPEEPAVYAGADQVQPYLAGVDEEAWFRPRQTPEPPPQPPQPTPTVPSAAPAEQPAPPPTPPAAPEAEEPPPAEPTPAPPPPAPVVETFEPFNAYSGMAWPLYGEVVMPFSMDALILNPTLAEYRVNDNMRISAYEGDPVRAGADGRVVSVGNSWARGNYVKIYHGDGWYSTLGQLMENALVSEGDIVRAGQVVGGVGRPSPSSSLNGTHVHLHITHEDRAVNPYELLSSASDY